MDVQHPGKKIVILEVPTKDDEYGIDWRKKLLMLSPEIELKTCIRLGIL